MRYLFIFFVLLTGQQLFSQEHGDTTGKFARKNFKEELVINTDRDIYIPGEEVGLKYMKNQDLPNFYLTSAK